MSKVYPLGGRVFRLAEQTTGRQDGWVMVQMEDAGILKLAATSGLSDEEAARAVMVQAFRTEKFFAILAGALVEDGVPWSVESATANAEFFANLSDPEQKQMLLVNFVEIIASFFLLAGKRSSPSPTSSTKERKPGKAYPRKKGELLTDMLVGSGPTRRAGSPTATATA